MAKKEERIKPIVITLDDGTSYTLTFNRESVRFAESRGFKIDELFDYPLTNIPMFWFLAFRANHKNVARSKTDKILEDMHGLSKDVLERLFQLYHEPYDSLVVLDDDAEKKSSVTVEL